MPDLDFSNFTPKQKQTADYEFYNLEGQPKLRCVHAGESNKPYFNAVLRRADHFVRRKAKINSEMLVKNRNDDRELFAQHVVVGWPVAPKDRNGADAPFTKENALAFLKAIPDNEFDDFREWARDNATFVGEQLDSASAAGNSPTV